MKALIGIYLKQYIVRVKTTMQCIKETKKFMKKETEKIGQSCLLTGTPPYGNIGDIAITEAQIQFLKDIGISNILEVPITVASWYRKILSKKIPKTVKICNQGGGNMGIKWFDGEEYRRQDLKLFINHDIIIFPQTFDYGNTEKGQEELKKSIDLYSIYNQKLHIFARENISFEQLKKTYNENDVQLTPDIVLYLNRQKSNVKRNGIIFAIREDKEKKVSKKQMDEIIEIAKNVNKNVIITDTVINKNILKDDRATVLEKKLEQFRKARLVVTDRLHGMIFAAITGTPCLAFSNSDHKIKGVYEWIKNLGYIIYLEDYKNVEEEMKRLYNMDTQNYDNSKFLQEYDKIKRCILNVDNLNDKK